MEFKEEFKPFLSQLKEKFPLVNVSDAGDAYSADMPGDLYIKGATPELIEFCEDYFYYEEGFVVEIDDANILILHSDEEVDQQ